MFTTGVNYDVLASILYYHNGNFHTFRRISSWFSADTLQIPHKADCADAVLFSCSVHGHFGGVTGRFAGFPVLDYAFRGTYWIVGHFHYVMAGTALCSRLIAGLYYWWPKITKRKYNETFAKVTFAVSFIGFNVLYFPYFFLLDMPRRISTYPVTSGWASLNFDATVGAFVFGPAILLTLLNLIISYRKNEPCEPNPWEAKEMEWTGNYSGLNLDSPGASENT